MGVDVSTYRCRIGMFIPDHGPAGVIIINFTSLIKIIGCVSFVKMLLIMSGIEQNPGPDTFTFRYQFLLIHIGTDILRKLFLVMAGNDVGKYLASKSRDIRQLTAAKVITPVQKQMLIPVNNQPCIADFDITLLSCLLRNICGLCPPTDHVWVTPAPTDTCIEADIARLRMCRNELMHSDKLRLPDAELDAKWKKLSVILTRLNQKAGIAQLQKLIDDAEHMDVDEDLRNEYDETIKAWEERDKIMDHGIRALKSEVSEVKYKVSDVKHDVLGVKHELIGVKKKMDDEVSDVKHEVSGVKHEVTDVKHKVVDVRHEVSGVRHEVSDVRHEVSDVKHEVSDVKHEVSDVKHDVSDVKHEVSDVKHDVSDVKHEVSDVKHEVSDVKHEVSDVKHEVSDVKHEVSDVKHDVSDVKHEVSDVKHVVSDVKHEVSDVKHEVSDVKHEVSDVKHELIGVKKKLDDVAQSLQKNERQQVELTEIQQDIIEIYRYYFKTLPVSPVFENTDVDLLHAYQSPTMYRVEPMKKNLTGSNVNQTKDAKPIRGYGDIFREKDKSFKQIFITGDAGVGKTSFCKHLCLLWCMAKSGDRLDSECEELQKDVDFISKFEYVFYINLRETSNTYVLDMIIGQLFHSKEKYEDPIKSVLRHKQCLVLMDGMDEWSPKTVGRKKHKIPEKIYSENCVYLTTCRPYRIESVRLSHQRDIEHQIQMTGISGNSSARYVENVIDCMNKQTASNKEVLDFEVEIDSCGLNDHICIPLIASHLVVLWFENSLADMPRALIYSYILEMLFKSAKVREVEFPPSSSFTLKLPDNLSGLKYLNKYVAYIYKLCYLSFCSMFKDDENVMNLVFTRDQLESEPYCFSVEETDFFCKIGILSRSEVFGCYSEERLKISFIHKSYLEFFAALFISSFDSNNLFIGISKRWECLYDVLPCENFLLFLAGFSYDGIKQLFDNIYLQLSDNLTLIRRNAIFHYNQYLYKYQIRSLQNIVVNCYEEFSRSQEFVALKMEDFLFDDDSNVDILRQLLWLNRKCVKSIHSVQGKYYPEFDRNLCLQYLHVDEVSSADYVRFIRCMLQNRSTLHTVCIQGDDKDKPWIKELALISLHHLTSLSLFRVKMQHNSLHYLVEFLSNNVLIENIQLQDMSCYDHQTEHSDMGDWSRYIDCTFTLNLPQHTKLTSLCLQHVNILCNNVNISSLQSVILSPLSEMIVTLCYNDLFNCIEDSPLKYLHTSYISDYNTMETFTSTVKTLPSIKCLGLGHMKLPDDFSLQLHPRVTQVEIRLWRVTMSGQCFHYFIQSCISNKSETMFRLDFCNITSVDGDTHSVLSKKESVKYMSEYLESVSTVNITYKRDGRLYFETTNCQ